MKGLGFAGVQARVFRDGEGGMSKEIGLDFRRFGLKVIEMEGLGLKGLGFAGVQASVFRDVEGGMSKDWAGF